MFPNWLIFAALAGLGSNAANFVNRYVLRNGHDPTAYAWWFEVVRTIIFTFWALFNFQLIFSYRNLSILLLLGIVEFLSVYVFMKMHAFTELSISSVIVRLRLIWVPLLALAFLGESLSYIEYVGIITIFTGSTITIVSPKIHKDKGIMFAFIASFTAALLAIFMKMAIEFTNTPVIMIFQALPTILIFPLIMKNPRKRIYQTFKKNIDKNIMSTIFNVFAMTLLVLALRSGFTSKVIAVYQSMLIVTVLAGIIFLKENKRIKRKIIASIVTALGIWLLV